MTSGDQAASAAAVRPAVSARDRRARIAASAVFAVQGLCFAVVIARVPALRDKFHLGDLELTAVLAAVPLIAGLGSIAAGIAAPRIGSAAVLRVASIGVPLFTIAIGLAGTKVLLDVVVGFFGFFIGAVDASMNMQGVAIQRRYGRSILASCHAWWSVAGISGALAASQAHQASLAVFLGTAGVVGLILALSAGPSLLTHAVEDVAASEPNPVVAPPVDPKVSGAGKIVFAVGVAVMIMFIGDSASTTWSAIYLKDELVASDRLVPLGLAAYLGFQLLGRTLADRVIGRFGALATLVAGSLVAMAGFVAVASAPGVAIAVAGFALVGLGLSVVVPLAFSAADALDPAGTGAVIAKVNLFNYAGVVLGAASIGLINDAVGLRVAFAVPAGLVVVICAVAPAFRSADAARARSIAAR